MGTENPIVVAKPEILLLDAYALAGIHLPLLRERYHVTLGHSVAAAAEYLRRTPSKCDFLISDIAIDAEETFSLFRTAKSLMPPPTILVTTTDAGRVPDALLSGADTALLKPFPPNLLFSRLGRLEQERNARQRNWTAGSVSGRRSYLDQHSVATVEVHCPHCNAAGAITFDFLSHRRAWHACLACKKAWIAKRTA